MSAFKPIRTEEDHRAALARIETLMAAEMGSDEGNELDVLTDLVQFYEERHQPVGYPGPVAAIQFRMEQAGLSQRDLVPLLGSRAKVSEILSGVRRLTLPMARALHEHLGIPAEVLLREHIASPADQHEGLEWERFPLKAMANAGWIPSVPNLRQCAETLIRDLIHRAGVTDASVLYRKMDTSHRLNAKTDHYALKAWCWQVLAQANQYPLPSPYEPGRVTEGFLRKVAQLSWSADGPRLACEFLAKHGLPLVVVPHLPRTYLDGAVLRAADDRPVIGLTLRHDRLDNFWFCLLHELAHVGRHIDSGRSDAFVDDLTLRRVAGESDPLEREADAWAEEALIPLARWNASEAKSHPTPMAVVSLANSLQVHPAVVAGRVRFERKNYRMLSAFVGTGEVTRQLMTRPRATHRSRKEIR